MFIPSNTLTLGHSSWIFRKAFRKISRWLLNPDYIKKKKIIKRKKKRQTRRFDSTLGYPGEGPPQSNPQEKYNIVSLNIGGAGSQITQEKYRKLITWMVEAKVDILCIQETQPL